MRPHTCLCHVPPHSLPPSTHPPTHPHSPLLTPLRTTPTHAGAKSRFYGLDEEQCGVEELALQHYATEEGGGWQGVHWCAGAWSAMGGGAGSPAGASACNGGGLCPARHPVACIVLLVGNQEMRCLLCPRCSEGGVWAMLFGLLLWDVLFMPVPDVFRTPFQVGAG